MRVMWLVFEKKRIFSTDVYSGKNFFSRFGFSLQFFFFSKIFVKCVYFTFEGCLSLIIMASGSQLKVKTIKNIYHINSSCRVFYYKYRYLNM